MSRKSGDPRWLTAREQQTWLAYRQMRTLLDLQLARDLAADSELSEPDYDVLSTLSEAPGSRWRAGDLARRLSWSTSRLTHHTIRMQARGLVERETIADDARGTTLRLTDEGLATLQAAAPPHVESVRKHFMDLLTRDEVETLHAISQKVVTHLQAFDGAS